MSSEHDRILDANLNRLREGLRVIEEHARFVLEDQRCAGRVKDLRHAVRGYVEQIGSGRLLAARDTPHDIGREITTADEGVRTGGEDVLAAAFARCQQATRVLEEYAKISAPAAAQLASGWRYELYTLEVSIRARGPRLCRLREGRLYVLITEALCRGDWRTTAEAVLKGGASCLQLREKGLADGELLARANVLREMTAEHHALLFINDRPDIAKLSKADGVHVGQDDLSVADVRRVVGGDVLVGKSTRTLEQLLAVLAEEPDYAAVGPMYPSGTKPQDFIAGLEYLRLARKRTELPLVAIGGIDAGKAGELYAGGADLVAVCSAVISAPDPGEVARAILAAK
jgi:thiamine-phosphate pyrophosphorylase